MFPVVAVMLPLIKASFISIKPSGYVALDFCIDQPEVPD
jgi:hypothetical protein